MASGLDQLRQRRARLLGPELTAALERGASEASPVSSSKLPATASPKAPPPRGAQPASDPLASRVLGTGAAPSAPRLVAFLGDDEPVGHHTAAPKPGQAIADYVALDGTGTKKLAGGNYDTGHFKLRTEAAPGGFVLHVDSFHHELDDKVQLTLWIRPRDGEQERFIRIATLQGFEPLTAPGRFEGHKPFLVRWSDLDAALAQLSPNLKLNNGDSLYLYAKWEGGHEWGLGRFGELLPPSRPEVMSAVALRSGMVPQAPLAAKPFALELGTWLPQDVVARSAPIARLTAADVSRLSPAEVAKLSKPVLKAGGKAWTKLEAEGKYEPKVPDGLSRAEANEARRAAVEEAVIALYALAQDPHAASAHFSPFAGPDWAVRAETMYWEKDDQGNVKVDEHLQQAFRAKHPEHGEVTIGSPEPMRDAYPANESLLRSETPIRIRANSKGTVLNAKVGPGVEDPELPGIRVRLESGMDLNPESTSDEVAEWVSVDTSPFNLPRLELPKVVPDLDFRRVFRGGTVDLSAIRHRFAIDYVGSDPALSGTSIQFTGDRTIGTSSRLQAMGKQSDRSGFEVELNHLNFGKAKLQDAAALPTQSGVIDDLASAKQWAAGLSESASLAAPVHFHTFEDLTLDVIETMPSYQALRGVVRGIQALFPEGVVAGHQKASTAARDLSIL